MTVPDPGSPGSGHGVGAGAPAGAEVGAAAVAERGAVRRAAVLGRPIAHSLSPVLHRAAYRAMGLTGWTYDAVDVGEAELAGFLDGLDGSWAGLSLTMPLKRAVVPLLDHVEPLADVVGAVNTVLLGAVRVGANTDVYGIVAALREGLARTGPAGGEGVAPEGLSAPEGLAPEVTSAVIIGAGATAASALAALGELGCTTPVVLARSLGRAGAVLRAAHRMGVEPVVRQLDRWDLRALVEQDVVVSTLPPLEADKLLADLDGAPPGGGVLLDVAYEPSPTALSVAWAARGGVVVPGERMLLHQAVEQVRLMTGRPAPVDAMAQALDDALAAPPAPPG